MNSLLALPAPTLERHLARTIDGRSLTGVPGAWSTRIKRRRFKAPKAAEVPLRWTYNITGTKATSRHRIWIVSTQHQLSGRNQVTSLGHYVAKSRADAKRIHRQHSSHLPKPYASTELCMGVEP